MHVHVIYCPPPPPLFFSPLPPYRFDCARTRTRSHLRDDGPDQIVRGVVGQVVAEDERRRHHAPCPKVGPVFLERFEVPDLEHCVVVVVCWGCDCDVCVCGGDSVVVVVVVVCFVVVCVITEERT